MATAGAPTPLVGYTGKFPVAGKAAVPDTLEGRVSSAKLALLKALGVVANTQSRLASHCLTASALASAILEYFRIPFRPTAGHFTLPGFELAIPHVWLESPDLPAGDGITDITYTDYRRKVVFLGQGVTVTPVNPGDPDAVRSSYFPGYDLPPAAGHVRGIMRGDKVTPANLLALKAVNLKRYMEEAPETVQAAMAAVLTQALDGTNTITLPAGAGPGAGAGTGAAPAEARLAPQRGAE